MGQQAAGNTRETRTNVKNANECGVWSDGDLLAAIAGRRDETAFAELFARYQQPAFNLASHLTGSQTLAQEAVQEGLWRVWTAAHTFKPGSNVRAWLLRIVAREALRASKTQRRQTRGVVKEFDFELEAAGGEEALAGEEKFADSELLQALRSQLERLDPSQRKLLALYFSAGLSQREISGVLRLTQQTISNRIGEALASLRRELSQAGYGKGMGLGQLEDGLLGAALSSLYLAPEGLQTACLARLGSARNGGPLQSTAPFRLRALHLSGVALLVAAVCAGGWWARQPGSEEKERIPQATSKAVPILQKRSAPQAQAQSVSRELMAEVSDAPHRMAWNFMPKPAEGIDVLSGRWIWNQGPREADMSCEALCALLPFPVRNRPLKIEMEVLVPVKKPESKVSVGLYWMDEHGAYYEQLGRTHYNMPLEAGSRTVKVSHYVVGRFIFSRINGVFYNVEEYEDEYPTSQLVFGLSTGTIQKMRAEELRPEEIPGELKDPIALIRGMNSRPEILQPGTVMKSR